MGTSGGHTVGVKLGVANLGQVSSSLIGHPAFFVPNVPSSFKAKPLC